MGVVEKPIPPRDDFEFVADLARFREGLLDEKAIRKKFRLADAVWEQLALDDDLVRRVEEESVRRTRDGSTKREKAQALVVKAPDVLGGIMSDPSASPRHRVDAIKVLDDFAANGPAAAPADRFVITINLGADVLKFDKSIAIDANDIDPHHPEPPMIAAIAAKKSTDGGNGPV